MTTLFYTFCTVLTLGAIRFLWTYWPNDNMAVNTRQDYNMNLINGHNNRYIFFRDITGATMKVYNQYRHDLQENIYEAALQYLLELKGYKVETSKEMVINDNIIVELKAVNSADNKLRRQLWNDMNMAQKPYGMLINFGPNGLFSEWYQRYPETGKIEKVYLI